VTRKLRFKQLFAASLAFGVVGAARAEPTSTLTFDERRLVGYALEHNAALRIGRLDVHVAAGQETTASTLENPVLKLDWLHATSGNVDDMGYGIGLAWTPPRPGEHGARVRAAHARVASAREDSREQATEVESEVRATLARVQALSAQLEITTRALANREKLEAMVRARVQHGASTRIDLNLVLLSIRRAEQERATIAVERAGVLRQLAALCGLPAGATLQLEDAPASAQSDAATANVPAGELETRAVAKRARLQSDTARITAAEETLSAERAARWPWISFSALPRYRYKDRAGYKHDLSFGLDVTLPIFDARGGKITAAQATRTQELIRRESDEAAVRREVAAAREQVERRRELVEHFDADIQPIIEEHGTLLSTALAGGQLDLVALLSAEDMVFRAQHDATDARLAYRLSLIELARATGSSIISSAGSP
jgi:multidrug efflux system outer membrane protein